MSSDLTGDQFELQKWAHEFAVNVVRQAAHTYDEREDFPWPRSAPPSPTPGPTSAR